MGTPSKDNPTSLPASLLLAGLIGHGKSSTGNCILGKKEFIPSNSNKQVTLDSITRALSQDKRIEVVDAFDIADDISENDEFVLKMRDKLFSLNHGGFSALLIVLKYGIRFTNQEQHAIKIIQSFLGQEVMRTHGIIVMTHRDNFELDFEDKDMCFEKWCSEKKGDIRRLFEKTGGRKVLFDNKTKDVGKRNKQVDQLLEKVKEIEKSSGRFTMSVAHAIPKEMNWILERLEEKYKEILEQLKKLRDKLNSQENRTGIKRSDIEDFKKIIDKKIQQMGRRCNEGKQIKEIGHSHSGLQPTVTSGPSNTEVDIEDNPSLVTSNSSNTEVVMDEKQPDVKSDPSNTEVASEENLPDVTNFTDSSKILSTSVTLDIQKEVSEILESLRKNNEEILEQLKKLRDNVHSQKYGIVIRKPGIEEYKKIIDKKIKEMGRWCKEDIDTIEECNGVRGKQNEEGCIQFFRRLIRMFLRIFDCLRWRKGEYSIGDEDQLLKADDLVSGANSAAASRSSDDLKDQPVHESGHSDKSESKISFDH